ncbi:MAG: RpiB/LacA/LacB family sugar-phosphate isomerase [Candidatus Spechtbacterales bacterium]|nr:RpiB/LacA/LacB family sugar-phosphate isomerase [Candidatus Spechtbacterales bacterium]
MKIYLATDHAGYELKEKIKEWLTGWNYDFEDMGAYKYNETDDYPDLIRPAVKSVAHDPENSKAIILGGSGQGEAMVANRYQGVRATVYYGGSEDILKLSREHNDANVLSLGARFLNEEETKKAIKIWLETKFSEQDRHVRRINKLN